MTLDVVLQGLVLDAPELAGADLNGGKVAGADESAHGLGGELKLLGDVGDRQESCAHTTMIPLLDPLHNS